MRRSIRCAVFDQNKVHGAVTLKFFDEEGQRLVFWHEGALFGVDADSG